MKNHMQVIDVMQVMQLSDIFKHSKTPVSVH